MGNVKYGGSASRLVLIAKSVGSPEEFTAAWTEPGAKTRLLAARWGVSIYDVRSYAVSLGLPSLPGPLPEPEPVMQVVDDLAVTPGPLNDLYALRVPTGLSESWADHIATLVCAKTSTAGWAEYLADLVADKLEARLTRKAKRGLFGGRA